MVEMGRGRASNQVSGHALGRCMGQGLCAADAGGSADAAGAIIKGWLCSRFGVVMFLAFYQSVLTLTRHDGLN
jgi:hypothetical protein